MIRAFLALPLPDWLCAALGTVQERLRLPRPVPEEDLHLTVAFLGDQPEPALAELDDALARLILPAPEIRVDGLGVFGGDRPRSLHATVAPDPQLSALRTRVLSAVRAAGLEIEATRFVPHVTLARFRPGETRAATLAAALGALGPVALPPARVGELVLYRSRLRPEGALHDDLARYPLRG